MIQDVLKSLDREKQSRGGGINKNATCKKDFLT